MDMKRTILVLATLLITGYMPEAAAQNTGDIIPGVSIGNFNMNRNGKYLTVKMEIDLTGLDVNANRAVLLTPRLVNGTDSLDLPSVGIYGRRRYYYYVRNGIGCISGENEMVYRASNRPDSVAYSKLAEYEEWMDGATLKFHRSDWGCCLGILAEYEGILGRHNEAFFPELIFVQPKAEIMKSRSLSGSAYIDFPVDQTVIYPDYRTHPELAIGRTAALKKHIGQLYRFADNIIQTDYEPEDWEGLRRYVEQSNIDHREEILAMIDSDLEPVAKETKIKRTYPEEYRFMLQHFYPALRHTDYRIAYVIRSYSDPEEIARVMREQPQKLSLNEFYLVAGKYEPGTDEFTDVFQTAVRMFPNDEVANLNAASAAIRRDDFETARRYLEKAGDSAEAVYARGALAVREGDCETARRHLNRAKEMGLERAAATLDEMDKRQQ